VLYADLDFTRAPWDTVSPACKDLVQSLLQRDPALRPTAVEALKHRYHILLMVIVTMIEVIVMITVIVVLLAKRHRKVSSEAHIAYVPQTCEYICSVHLQCVVMPQIFAPCSWYASFTSLGGVPLHDACYHRSCRKPRLAAFKDDYARHMYPNKMTLVHASELCFLCLLDTIWPTWHAADLIDRPCLADCTQNLEQQSVSMMCCCETVIGCKPAIRKHLPKTSSHIMQCHIWVAAHSHAGMPPSVLLCLRTMLCIMWSAPPSNVLQNINDNNDDYDD
jgi:hypothetical protein